MSWVSCHQNSWIWSLKELAKVALQLFLVFFPLGASLPTSPLLVSASSQEGSIRKLINRVEFQTAHVRLALFRQCNSVMAWNEESPFYQMIFHNTGGLLSRSCCYLLSGLVNFNPVEWFTLGMIIVEAHEALLVSFYWIYGKWFSTNVDAAQW